MRFAELDPHWFVLESGGQRCGLTFDCPHCKTTRLAVAFHRSGFEAIDDEYIRAHSQETQHIWTESGADFESLTLSPSVDASAAGHWHGFVTNGEVTNA